jgi:3'-phosphoadenosine 5'-phosphosulfate sulfotransferase (PAPS reductase)/FAD synthetase
MTTNAALQPYYELTHLQALEAEAIHIIREATAEFERRMMLLSGGKDSNDTVGAGIIVGPTWVA